MRRLGIVALAMLALFVAAPPSFASVTLTKPERSLLVLINQTRAQHNLHELRMITSLERAARAHSEEMVNRHYFNHASYSGESFGARLIRFGYSTSGCASWKVGECIAWGSGSLGAPKAIWRAWLKSAPHRAIILTKDFRDVGVGRAVGSYQGLRNVVFFTLDCGRRAR